MKAYIGVFLSVFLAEDSARDAESRGWPDVAFSSPPGVLSSCPLPSRVASETRSRGGSLRLTTGRRLGLDF